jgi:hypothetical protein
MRNVRVKIFGCTIEREFLSKNDFSAEISSETVFGEGYNPEEWQG